MLASCGVFKIEVGENVHSWAPGRPGEQRSYGEDAIWWNTKSSSWILIYFMIYMYFVNVILYFCDFGCVVYAYDLAFPEGIVKGDIFYSNKKSLLYLFSLIPLLKS